MAYIRHDWECAEIITSAKLNNIENGIEEALDCCESKLPAVTTDDNGDILTVIDGEWGKAEASPLKYVKDDSTDNGGVVENDVEHNVASGKKSHAEGGGTTASEYASHAEGSGTTASEYYSHAEGYATKASGNASHAEGNRTTASGSCSHAEGCGTVANHFVQHVFGEYNVEDPSTSSPGAGGTYIEIVGNGKSSSARSNARTLDWNGNEWLAGSLTLGNTTLTEAQLQALLALLN